MFSHFVEQYDPTIEDSYRKQTVIDGEAAMVDVLDTAGQEEYTVLRDQWLRSADCYVTVFDVTSRTSFEELAALHQHILRVRDVDSNADGAIPVVVVANKIDLAERRAVSDFEARELARAMGASYVEASAKTGAGVDAVFVGGVRLVRQADDRVRGLHANGGGKKAAAGGRRRAVAAGQCTLF